MGCPNKGGVSKESYWLVHIRLEVKHYLVKATYFGSRRVGAGGRRRHIVRVYVPNTNLQRPFLVYKVQLVVLFLLCVCVCDLFLFLQGTALGAARLRGALRRLSCSRTDGSTFKPIFTFLKDTRRSHELQIDLGSPAAFYFRLVLKTSCTVNAPRPT